MVNHSFIQTFQQQHPEVQLIAVTKYTDLAGVQAFVDAGLTAFGENRADALVKKQPAFAACTWHFIGHLQTNKVKQAIDHIDVLHSLDRLSLAQEIQKRASKTVPCFLQVKTTSDEKFGMMVEDVPGFLDALASMDRIEVIGFMTMAEFTNDADVIRQSFQTCKHLQERYGLPYLSMGMSADYPIAIEEGATHVRIGQLLYQGESK